MAQACIKKASALSSSPSLSTALLLPLGLRVFAACFGHSGEGQPAPYEGAPYGGDYEAQRHWMEITLHLPVGKWYFYDLQYWGLDYPPLTAFVSQACGWISDKLDPASVALVASRGFEAAWHKVFMRATVLFLDVSVYFSAVWLLAQRLGGDVRLSRPLVALALCQPALILIDHGHFQYNSVSLGLALYAFYFFTASSCKEPGVGWRDVIGSIFFCLALNFKQMSLYQAPAVFFFLLGRCASQGTLVSGVVGVLKLGIAVLLTFFVLWVPFCFGASPDVGCAGGLLQVLKRLFPFDRGVFEDKVANLWFALSVKPFSVRNRIPAVWLPKLAIAATALLFAWPCILLFRAGCRSHRSTDHGLRMLLWGSAACAYSFFLASFQVHEKSLLLVLSPLSLLHLDGHSLVTWQCVAGTWTMYPLLLRDGQGIPYIINLLVYIWLAVSMVLSQGPWHNEKGTKRLLPLQPVLVAMSAVVMLLLHVASKVMVPPPAMPDLWPTLWALAGCGIVSLGYLAALRGMQMVAMTEREGLKTD